MQSSIFFPVGVYLRNRLIQRAVIFCVMALGALEAAAHDHFFAVTQRPKLPGCQIIEVHGQVQSLVTKRGELRDLIDRLKIEMQASGANAVIDMQLSAGAQQQSMKMSGTAVKVDCSIEEEADEAVALAE